MSQIDFTPFSIIIIAFMAVLLMIWFKVWLNKIDKSLKALHQDVSGTEGETRLDVWISNEQEHRRPFKLLIASELGFLIIMPDSIILYSFDRAGKKQVRSFKRDLLQWEWLPKRSFSDYQTRWLALGSGPERILVSAFGGFNTRNARRRIQEISLSLTKDFPPTEVLTFEFALEKNAGTVVAMILLALFALYAVLDGLLINPLELVGDYLPTILSVSILCAALVFALALWGLKKMKVPTFEAMMLAIFLELAVAFAAVPGAKRIDTASAQMPMQDYEYRMIREGIFQAVDKNLPELDLRVKCDFWKQFKKESEAESEHPFFFPLQKGGLGLWQFDGRTLDADIETYLKKHPEQRRRR